MKLIILFSLISLLSALTENPYKTVETEQQLNEFSRSSPVNVLLFVDKSVCKKEDDVKCREQRSQLEQISQWTQTEHIPFAISDNAQLAEKQFNLYGGFPKLCLFRQGFPVIYSGSISDIDAIQEWFAETRERFTRTLDDKSFEHDTQAATGSTTGDWFILFKKSNDSRSLISVWEGTSLQFRNRVIFAYVDVDQNPLIQQRFHIFTLPSFILFKRGKMYRYEGTSWKQTTFVDFLDHGYEKVKAELVPPESSAFSNYFGKISMYFIIIPMLCLVIVLLVLISGYTKSKKSSDERPSIQVKID